MDFFLWWMCFTAGWGPAAEGMGVRKGGLLDSNKAKPSETKRMSRMHPQHQSGEIRVKPYLSEGASFDEKSVVKYTNAHDATDPNNGQYVVVTAINPAPLLFDSEHFRIFVPSLGRETYALRSELTKTEEI